MVDVVTPGLTLDSVFKRRDGCVWRMVEGRVIVLTPETYTIHELNRVGTAIWHLLEEPISYAQIVERLSIEYDAPVNRIAEDTARFLPELMSRRLITVNLKPDRGG